MLTCSIDLQKLTVNDLECGSCSICKARSKLEYPFQRDLKTSEQLVQALKTYIEANTPYVCRDTQVHKNPDIVVLDIVSTSNPKGRLVCRVEAKMLDGYAFMKAEELLGDHLKPKETLVIDEPKLLSYFECVDNDLRQHGKSVPIYVVWKFDRPCADLGGITVFQEVTKLRAIFEKRGTNRTFERKTVASDLDNGVKRGITAKYHFSLRECRPIEELIEQINAI
jgi:hypothetical protein